MIILKINSVVKLKNNYILFEEDSSTLCIYDKEKNLIVFKVKHNLNLDIKLMQQQLLRPNTLEYILKQPYRNIAGKLLKDYTDIFEELDEKNTLNELSRLDMLDVVSYDSFIEGTELSEDFSLNSLVVYGLSNVNLCLLETLKNNNFKEFILIDDESLVETTDIYNSLLYKFENLNETKKSIVGKHYCNNNKVVIKSMNFLKEMNPNTKYIHLVFKGAMDTTKLLEINDILVSKKDLILYFDINKEKVVIGPLVVSSESACLKCMDKDQILNKYYDNHNQELTCDIYMHLLCYFIKRTLYHIKGDNLTNLLEDVQIPINKIFSINKGNLKGEVSYIYKNIYCHCIRDIA